MDHYLEQIAIDLVQRNLERYWPNFERVAYAIFNKKTVHLFNHPKYKNDHLDSHKILDWEEHFVGNTIILYEGHPTAIADMDLYNDYEGIYSILVHELFHGFQYIKGEKRFPDEILGITYPLTFEIAELRIRERKHLYDALLETNISKKKQFLKEFIVLREKRATKCKEYTTYENLIETVEGPAWYVELKAYSEKSPLDNKIVSEKYGEHLLEKVESNLNIRRSCYSSGLCMCLLLDEFSPDWKESFFETNDTLFDLIKQLDVGPIPLDHIEEEISTETVEAVNSVIQLRKKEFKAFECQTGTHIFIEGEITALFFDPINILSFGGKFLHKNFVKVRINNNEYLVQQPTIAYCKDGLKHINKLHLYLKDNPIENTDSLMIPNVGKIDGRYTKRENTFYLTVN
ncbi:hypothetical protein D1B31_01400 [Neobacillus notoginsengisoli]|uniref:Peptide ABC transporter permease n=1 Tax=Neobacillus notoginsengisoli TaxID=1578198 RepID=A0A417YZQ9_9BACI|nr:hypothetical protein [Neobacillus notoginsengisoli]RHW43352.1 hypothetical protein D1B31_01400 [Neobacillus notoginsengisoli]